MTIRRLPLLSLIVVVAMVAAACGDGDAGSTTTSAPTSNTTTSEPTITTTEPTITTTTGPTTTTSEPTTTTLPGEPIDIGPRAGDVIAVIGVAHDDVLNVRAAPGTDQEIIDGLDPLADDIIALGNARALTQSIWIEVDTGDETGWVSLGFIGYLGQVTDETASIISRLGETPEAETMLDLGLIVAEAVASVDPPSSIVMSVAPSVGDLGEVTYDVVGLGDDAVRGLRLHVFGTPSESQEGFVLESVEQTLLCGRGLSDGLCS